MRVAVILISGLWLMAQAANSGFLAAGVCVAAIGGCCALVLTRRPRRGLAIATGTLVVFLGVFLAAALWRPFDTGYAIVWQLGFLLCGAFLIPLIYALTLPGDDR